MNFFAVTQEPTSGVREILFVTQNDDPNNPIRIIDGMVVDPTASIVQTNNQMVEKVKQSLHIKAGYVFNSTTDKIFLFGGLSATS